MIRYRFYLQGRQLPEYPGITFFEDGRVRSFTGKFFKRSSYPGHRAGFSIRQKNGAWKTYLQHRGICEAFNGPAPTPDHVVRHLNDHWWDNRAVNLAWGTLSENSHDRFAHRDRGCCSHS